MNDLSPSLIRLIDQSINLEKWPIAQLISLFESSRVDHQEVKAAILLQLQGRIAEAKRSNKQEAYVIGITGTPGAGKSSLIGEFSQQFLQADPIHSLAIIAIDPSSHISGGAILGDRTRVPQPNHLKRFFFRSQSNELDLGGVSHKTFLALRLLRLLFDFIIIETVGIGQNEIEVQHLADYLFLVMQPLSGDQIQFMKSGIMEVPDAFIINKCDEEKLAKQSYHTLRTNLKMARIAFKNECELPIFMTSALKKQGISEWVEFVRKLPAERPKNREFSAIEEYYFFKWVKEEFGLFGLAQINQWQQANPQLWQTSTFEQKKTLIESIIKSPTA